MAGPRGSNGQARRSDGARAAADPRGARTVNGRERPIEGTSDDFLSDPALVKALGPFDLDERPENAENIGIFAASRAYKAGGESECCEHPDPLTTKHPG